MGEALLDYNSPLSEAERRFAEERHNVIYKFLNQKQLPESEYYDVAAIGYLKAVRKYLNIEKLRQYSFTTISFASMRREIFTYRRSEYRKAKKQLYDTEDYIFAENIADSIDIGEYVCEREYHSAELEKILPLLSENEIKIFLLKSQGYKHNDIAGIMRYKSKKSVESAVTRVRRRVEKKMKGGGTVENWRSVDYDEVTRLYEQGLSDQKIAEGAGCCRRSVQDWRGKNNLPSNLAKGKKSSIINKSAIVPSKSASVPAAVKDDSGEKAVLTKQIDIIAATIKPDDSAEKVELYKTFLTDLFRLSFDEYIRAKQNR